MIPGAGRAAFCWVRWRKLRPGLPRCGWLSSIPAAARPRSRCKLTCRRGLRSGAGGVILDPLPVPPAGAAPASARPRSGGAILDPLPVLPVAICDAGAARLWPVLASGWLWPLALRLAIPDPGCGAFSIPVQADLSARPPGLALVA